MEAWQKIEDEGQLRKSLESHWNDRDQSVEALKKKGEEEERLGFYEETKVTEKLFVLVLEYL